jgi:hypothetical protein
MFAILDKAKPNIENVRGLNLAAVRHTTVIAEATRNKGIHNPLYSAWADRGPVLIVYTLITMYNVQIVNIFYSMTSNLLLQTMTLTKDRPAL